MSIITRRPWPGHRRPRPAAPLPGVIPLAGTEERAAAVLPAGPLVAVTCLGRQALLRLAGLCRR